MPHFSLESLPKKPQEDNMRKSEKEQLNDRKKEEQQKGQEGMDGKPVPPSSVFYPLAEAVRMALCKKLNYLPPTKEQSEDLMQKIGAVEVKYGGDKIAGVEAQAISSFATPLIFGFIENFKHKGTFFGQKEDKKGTISPDKGKENVSPASPPPSKVPYGKTDNDLGLTPQQRGV